MKLQRSKMRLRLEQEERQKRLFTCTNMAHSIQVFRGKSEVINDLDLMVVIGFALPSIRSSKEYAALEQLAENWQGTMDNYGPGTIDLKLEILEDNPELASKLDLILGDVLHQIEQFGESIPRDLLSKKIAVRGVVFNDFNTSFLRDAIRKLKALVTQ